MRMTYWSQNEDDDTNYPYFFDHGRNCWVVATGLCSLDGCFKDFIECEDKEQAYQKALELTQEGKEVEMTGPCPSCYAQYQKDCI